MRWSEKKPAIGALIPQEDGRTCRLKDYRIVTRLNEGRRSLALAVPRAFMVTVCGDEIPVRRIPPVWAYPVPEGEVVTCLKCLTQS